MKIKLLFPDSGIATIQSMGLRQPNPEILRLVFDHPASHYGAGVILRGKSDDMLNGTGFQALADNFGAWIECDSERTKKHVELALVTAATGLSDRITVNARTTKI